MEIRVLKYFLTLCELGSITAAAQALNMTQPALSRQLMNLEDELTAQLFIREKRGITLTLAGQRLKLRAQEIISMTDATAAEIAQGNFGITGELRLGAGDAPSVECAVQAFKRLQAKHPGIHVHFYNPGSRDIQAEWLENGVIDFALMGVVPSTKRFANIKLSVQDSWGLLVHKNSPLAQQECIVPENLKGLPLLTGHSENFRSLMSGWLGYDFHTLNIVGSSFTQCSTEYLVKEEIACAVIRSGIFHENPASDVCFRPFAPAVVSNVYLVWHNGHAMSKVQELFLREIKQGIGDFGGVLKISDGFEGSR